MGKIMRMHDLFQGASPSQKNPEVLVAGGAVKTRCCLASDLHCLKVERFLWSVGDFKQFS